MPRQRAGVATGWRGRRLLVTVTRTVRTSILTWRRDIHNGRHILPKAIRDYISTVQSCLDYIVEADAGVTLASKVSFFQEARHAFGRTALVLSGGGALGAFHLVRQLVSPPFRPWCLNSCTI
jgi:hypothetical protein